MNKDDSLYNAMIIALSIGIIIVIITLIITRPAPENFTELYFNNHTSIPEYLGTNDTYTYSFNIHNLENKDVTYNYTITTSFYKLDYTCERPTLYLEGNETERTTETNDPALIITTPDYGIKFKYDTVSGDGNITFGIVDINNKPKYAIIFTQDTIYYNSGNDELSFRMTKSATHNINIQANKQNMTLNIDTKTYTLPNNNYTGGYIHLETTKEFAYFSDFTITRENTTEPVNIQYDDAKYTQYYMQTNKNTYYTTEPVNLTTYTATVVFRTTGINGITLNLKNDTEISYDRNTDNIIINTDNETKKYYVPYNASIITNTISTKVNDTTISIYYNDKYITTIKNTNTTITPIITYNNVSVNNFYIKGDNAPITINYYIPRTQTTADIITLGDIKEAAGNVTSITNITNLNIPEGDPLTYTYSDQYINNTNYMISIQYKDDSMNNSISIALTNTQNNVYAIIFNDTGKATINYMNKTLKTTITNISTSSVNKATINIRNSTMIITFNNKNIFRSHIEQSGGLLIFDYENITLLNTYQQDTDTGTVKVYNTRNIECNPILQDTNIKNGSITITNKDTKTITHTAVFNKTYDTAQEQITLDNGEEIHYWIKYITK